VLADGARQSRGHSYSSEGMILNRNAHVFIAGKVVYELISSANRQSM